ncbi:MAG TPA: DUF1587 domain-containing protein, partial [Luteolibacter sp.]|nr:DUF1587 domain-containing protein [Luteolibacter sp.]
MPVRHAFLPLLLTAASAFAADPAWTPVRPVMEKYCFECHGGKKTKGGVDLKKLADDPDVAGNFELWEKVHEAVTGGDMPPENDPQLSSPEKDLVVKWLHGSIDAAAHANAGDPGNVTVRRLTNAEYDNTIRSLTGIDFGLGKEFLPDGGGGEGFSNVGDVLFVSPQQLDKYLSAARKLTEHAAVLPGRGVLFQEERVGLRSPIQLRQQTEQSLYVWYQKMAEPYVPKDGEDQKEAAYMLACWKFKHKELTGADSLEKLADEAGLTLPFLTNWWDMLNGDKPKSRFLDLTRFAWRDLPAPDASKPKDIPSQVTAGISKIQDQRRSWTNQDSKLGWVNTQRRQQDSDGLRTYEVKAAIRKGQPIHLVVGDTGDGAKGDLLIVEKIAVQFGDKRFESYPVWLKKRVDQLKGESTNAPPERANEIRKFISEAERVLPLFGKHPEGREIADDSIAIKAPASLVLPFGEEALLAVRGKLDLNSADADAATLQYSVTGSNPPDPTKIIPGALVLWKRQTPAARETMNDFSSMKSVFPDEYARRLERVARNFRSKDGKSEGVYYLSDEQLFKLIPQEEKDRHRRMMKDWEILGNPRQTADLFKKWDEAVLSHLNWFASKAWRRPVNDGEKKHLADIYTASRGRELDQESAAREVLMRILIAPDFIFRLENAGQPGIQPVTAHELASRLSYFLWSSMPDTELRKT